MKKLSALCLWVLLGLMPFAVMAQSSEPTPDNAGAAPATAPAPEQAAGTAAAQGGTSQPALAEIPVTTLPDQAAAPVKEETSPNTVKLDEVVVTVTKRAQNVRNIPSSIAVLQGEKLEKLGIRKVKDIIALVPGVNMQDEIGGLQRKVSVRGAGPDTGTNQTVGSVLGDIPISDPYGATTIIDPNPWDMSTVEVLKGPQGTLFGASSLAGLIRYVPNYPKLGRWEGKTFYEYTMVKQGSNAPNVGFMLNAPVGDALAFRASAIFQKLPGVIDSNNPSRTQKDVDTGRNWAGRVMGLWQPMEKLTINAWFTADERRADDINLVTFAEPTYERNDAPTPSNIVNGYNLGTLDVRYSFDWFTAVSLTGYQKKKSFTDIEASYLLQPLATSGVSFTRTDRKVRTRGLLQEFRLVSPNDGKFTWVGGLIYSTFSETIRARLFVTNPALTPLDPLLAMIPPDLLPLAPGAGLVASDSRYDPLDADEQALYAEGNYDFTEKFRLTLGSRLYRTQVNGVLMTSGASSANDGATPGTTEKGFSPKIAVTYRLSKDIMFYGNVARGFQFGGFNLPTVPSQNVPLTFKSSSLFSYEIGARTDWFDRALRFDITAFFIDWKNPQVSQVEPNGVNIYVDNVGGTHNIGVESTLRWKTPLRGFTIEQTGSYIEARTTTPFTDASGRDIPKGTLFPSSPLVQAVTTLSYSRELGDWTTQFLIINSLQGKSFSNIAHTTSVGDFSLLGATFNLARDDWAGSPALTFSVNNILDKRKLAAGFGPAPGTDAPQNNIVANSSYVYSQPRSMVMRLSLEF